MRQPLFKTLLTAMLLLPATGALADDYLTLHTEPIQNPMLWADVPDPDIIRVDDTFYLVSTTMHLMPGAPIMKSKDLKNWETVGYIFDKLTDSPKYDSSLPTNRVAWAIHISSLPRRPKAPGPSCPVCATSTIVRCSSTTMGVSMSFMARVR